MGSSWSVRKQTRKNLSTFAPTLATKAKLLFRRWSRVTIDRISGNAKKKRMPNDINQVIGHAAGSWSGVIRGPIVSGNYW